MVLSFSREDVFLIKQAARIGADYLNTINNLDDSRLDFSFCKVWSILVHLYSWSQLKSWGVYWPWIPTLVFLIL